MFFQKEHLKKPRNDVEQKTDTLSRCAVLILLTVEVN